ncbi:MAG: glycerophosphodiester phosphodiesterase family protein [Candidatus Parvarchaeota archaeon]|nr:glycerophosphodiester phosphodiesterase family protein [Candidatus Parvarchaeota archaeon]MCW1301530.1 glycerophosphodiester phosphodiesterase family protein [Candidatus Parvarchaeota archaeon]
MEKPLLYGHRGAAFEAPENTIPSFKTAKEIGVYGVEMDLHTTKDNELVVMHDETLDRTTEGRGFIHDHTLDEIKKLDAGIKFGKKWEKTRVPTLKEVFEEVGTDIHYYLEIKQSYKIYPHIEEKVLDLIDDFKLKNNVQIISFDFDSLERLRELDKSISLGVLFVSKVSWMVDISKRLGGNWVQPDFYLIYKDDVDLAHKNGFKVAAWTVDTELDIRRAVSIGVDSITSNNPRFAKQILSSI